MIKSQFISNILELLVDGYDSEHTIRSQVKYLTEEEYEYTSVGLYVRFSHDTGIEDFKASDEKLILDGLIITSKELEVGAEAILHFNNGLADYLDIWSSSGEYPRTEIEKYDN